MSWKTSETALSLLKTRQQKAFMQRARLKPKSRSSDSVYGIERREKYSGLFNLRSRDTVRRVLNLEVFVYYLLLLLCCLTCFAGEYYSAK